MGRVSLLATCVALALVAAVTIISVHKNESSTDQPNSNWLRSMSLERNGEPGAYLIITSDMRDRNVPSNVRICGLAKALRADQHHVVVVSKNGGFAPEFEDELKALAVEIHSPVAEENFFTEELIAARRWDAAFLQLWFWTAPSKELALSVPQTYMAALRTLSPSTKIVVLTDDAHAARQELVEAANRETTNPVDLGNTAVAQLAEQEADIYANAHVVLTVSEEDQQTVRKMLEERSIATPVAVLHWGHSLALSSGDARASPAFDRRSGLVFVGFGRNPSNRVALSWFMDRVHPLLTPELQKVPLYVVGSGSQELVTDMRRGRKLNSVFAIGTRDDATLRGILDSSRVLIAPAAGTGLTTKVLFGMSHGLPVVATEAAAAGYRVADGSAGKLEDSLAIAATPEAFAASLATVYTDAAEWARLSAAGVKYADAFASPARFAQDVKSALTIAAGQGLRRAILPAHFVPAIRLMTMESALKADRSFHMFSGSGSSSTAEQEPSTGGEESTGGSDGSSGSAGSSGGIQACLDNIVTLFDDYMDICKCENLAECSQYVCEQTANPKKPPVTTCSTKADSLKDAALLCAGGSSEKLQNARALGALRKLCPTNGASSQAPAVAVLLATVLATVLATLGL